MIGKIELDRAVEAMEAANKEYAKDLSKRLAGTKVIESPFLGDNEIVYLVGKGVYRALLEHEEKNRTNPPLPAD